MKTENNNIAYKLLERHSADHVELQFNGTLQKRAVVWHAHIHTLRDYCLHELLMSQTGIQQPASIQAQPFIYINIQNNVHSLTAALNLPAIDEAAILRTIIMIRQYKRLQPGRHQYGDIATFRFDTN